MAFDRNRKSSSWMICQYAAKETAVTDILKTTALTLLLVLGASAAKADIDPDWVRQNTALLGHGECTDQETGQEGYCVVSWDGTHYYMTFLQGGVPVVVRRTTEQGYEQVWPEHRPGGSEL